MRRAWRAVIVAYRPYRYTIISGLPRLQVLYFESWWQLSCILQLFYQNDIKKWRVLSIEGHQNHKV